MQCNKNNTYIVMKETDRQKHCKEIVLLPINTALWGFLDIKKTGSRLFTEIKPCWTGLISGWVTISMKYPVLYSLGSQVGVVDINHAFHLYYKCCMWIEFQSIST